MSYLPNVITVPMQGVTVARHELDVELARLAHILRSVGMRLQRAMRQTRAGEGEDVKPLPEGFPELLEWHSKTMRWLLAEQRERAKLRAGTGLEVMTDEQYDRELKDLAMETLREMPESELNALLALREPER